MNHEPMPDVPVERSSVGAMGWMGNPYPDRFLETFKPYVYGQSKADLRPSIDVVADQIIEWGHPKPERKPKPRLAQNRRKPKARRKRYRRHTWVYTPPPVYVEPEPVDDGEKFPAYVPALPTVLRPAPGWEPTSGAELEALLEEMS